MESLQALRHMVSMSGKSTMAISRDMGIAEKYVGMTISRKSVPKLDTFADIAEACGYEVQIVGHDETIVIDGKRRLGRMDDAEKSLGSDE